MTADAMKIVLKSSLIESNLRTQEITHPTVTRKMQKFMVPKKVSVSLENVFKIKKYHKEIQLKLETEMFWNCEVYSHRRYKLYFCSNYVNFYNFPLIE